MRNGLLTREQLEAIEDRTLAPYAQRARESRGRRYAEPEHPYRTAYQRDRDRIIHSSAFRRLQYKTQVFVNHEGDYYRTRITHTLEVSQVARSIARALGLNQDLTEAVALAHDLGHTPFGHCGERVLDELLREAGGFEHNAQSYRIVTVLENRYPDWPGLNLTYEVLEGVDKHRTRYDRDGAVGGEQYTLEAQVVDLADDIAYNGHDLDDGLTSGLLDFSDLEKVPLVSRCLAEVRKSRPGLDSERTKYQTVRRLLDFLVTDLLEETGRRIEKYGIRAVEDVRKCREEVVAFSKETQSRLRELKAFLYERMYRHHRVVRMEAKAERVLRELFRIYEGMPDLLPNTTRRKIREGKEPVRRILGDYVAGMTDRYAIEEYSKLTDPTRRV